MARPSLTTHRKFLRLARALGGSKVLARGILETLWAPCYEAGDAYLGTADDIEVICEWKGPRGDLAHALLEAGAPKGAGFIEPYAGNVRDATQPHYQVHDLFQNAPGYVSTRAAREVERNTPKVCAACGAEYFAAANMSRYCSHACRQTGWRHRKRSIKPGLAEKRDVTRDVTPSRVTSRETLRDSTPAPAPAPVPVPPLAVRAVRRRGGDGTTAAALTCAAAAPADPDELLEDPQVARLHQTPQDRRRSPPQPDDSPIVLTFPVTGQDGPTWLLREAQMAEWQALYPDLDLLAQARQALAWIQADRLRRKTAGGMRKFLVSWFNRSVDSARARGPTLITGSLKTAGNKAAFEEFVRRNDRVDEG